MLRGLKAAAIVRAVADAAERWSDADFPPRVRVAPALAARFGYSDPVVDYALDQLFSSLQRGALEAAIIDELGSLAALDGPVTRHGGTTAFARGVERVAIVSSTTTIGVALVTATYALCAKSQVVVADRSDALVTAFFATLVDERPEFGLAASARVWRGGADPPERELLASADVVVAFGGASALAEIRAGVRADARFIGFGPRTSIGFVATPAGGGAQRAALLTGIATDTLLYDGDGCLALHALFVAGEIADVRAFVAELSGAFERVALEFPSGTATIAFDPPRDGPPPSSPRVLPIFPVRDADEVRAYVGAQRLAIEALGVVDPRAAAALALAEGVGAVRIASLGGMHAPPVTGHQGGAPRITDFVRWIDCA